MKKPLRDNRWFLQAACQGLDPAIFYPEDETMWPEAGFVKDLCSSCPVRVQCIDFSVTSRYQEEGWWGLPPSERRALRNTYRASVKDYENGIAEFANELSELDNVKASNEHY